MKIIFVSFLMLLSYFIYADRPSSASHSNLSTSTYKEDLDKWKKSTINIEVATDSISYHKQMELFEKYQNNEITEDEFEKRYNLRKVRSGGTALFVKYKNKKYLVTARHVLYDPLEAKRHIDMAIEGYKKSNMKIGEFQKKIMEMESESSIYDIIFRVENLKEYRNKKGVSSPDKKYLQCWMGAPKSYTFSDKDLDLAVISLEVRLNKDFLNDLEDNGYQPIVIDSIWNKSIKEGDNIFCIGFPVTSIFKRDDKADLRLNASIVSLPTTSFGRIAMNDAMLYFFWGDLSAYPGNSGGPVISNDTLIGIVSGQAVYDHQRIPFAKIIKIQYVKDLLEEQIKEDELGRFIEKIK